MLLYLDITDRCVYGIRSSRSQPSQAYHTLQLSGHTIRECETDHQTGECCSGHWLITAARCLLYRIDISIPQSICATYSSDPHNVLLIVIKKYQYFMSYKLFTFSFRVVLSSLSCYPVIYLLNKISLIFFGIILVYFKY